VEQPPRGELVRLARPAQRREDVELPALEVVVDEDPAPREVEAPGQAGDPGEDVRRARVEVGPLPAPGRDDAVDLVLTLQGAVHHPPRLLDIEINLSHPAVPATPEPRRRREPGRAAACARPGSREGRRDAR